MSQALDAADLRHVDTWIFDLDNTLYPAGSDVGAQMDARITAFVQRETGLPPVEALALQKQYFHQLGTTLAGLALHHGVEPHGFLAEVHDVSLDSLTPDPAMAMALRRLPGRRLIFTNASSVHAVRTLEHLGLTDLFDEVFHLEASEMTPKPQAGAYASLMRLHGVNPKTSAFFEDTLANLEPAAALGMTTVLVRPDAFACAAAFVDHRTDHLAAFLDAAATLETV
ncbi:MAG: pyrimidine 5'-nucleotidase [Caulobacteraceae bacterium]